MATDAAEWPSTPSIPQPTKDLLNRFYRLSDTKSDDVGRQYAEDIFTSDGKIVVNRRQFRGKKGMIWLLCLRAITLNVERISSLT